MQQILSQYLVLFKLHLDEVKIANITDEAVIK